MAQDPTITPIAVPAPAPGAGGQQEPPRAFDPQKLLRIAGVTREIMEESRRLQPDAKTTEYLREVLDRVCAELREALPDELYRELDELTPDLREGSREEVTLANAEILGWLQGLFQGTQLAIQLHALQQQQPPLPAPAPPKDAEPGSPDSQYL